MSTVKIHVAFVRAGFEKIAIIDRQMRMAGVVMDVTSNRSGRRSGAAEIAVAVSSSEFTTLPPVVACLAKYCFLDLIGVTVAGAREPVVEILSRDVAEWGRCRHCTLIARFDRSSPDDAALINGTSAHVLDYDDVNMTLIGHPTAPIVPALLACAEVIDASGEELMIAFVAGYETACGLGSILSGRQYHKLGLHTSSTLGGIGAAAACARLLRLDAERTSTAIALAATQAAGLKAVFGSMSKPLHLGNAARIGLRSARLAQLGLTSSAEVFERDPWLYNFNQNGSRSIKILASEKDFYIQENLFKFHAACFDLHAPIEALISIMGMHGLSSDDVVEATARVPSHIVTTCPFLTPRDGTEAKFSITYGLACVLAGVDTGSPAAFSDQMVQSAELQSKLDRVRVEFTDDVTSSTVAEVVVLTADNQRVSQTHDSGIAEHRLDVLETRLLSKFDRLMHDSFSQRAADRIADEILHLEQLRGVRDLIASLSSAHHASH